MKLKNGYRLTKELRVEVTISVTDEQIRDSIIQPEKSKAVEDSEEDDASVEQVKIS